MLIKILINLFHFKIMKPGLMEIIPQKNLINLVAQKALDSELKDGKKELYTDLTDLKKRDKELGKVWNSSDAKQILGKLTTPKYQFIRSKESKSDLGTIKKDIVLDYEYDSKSRFSYLSILDDVRGRIEDAVGMASKGIKIDGIKLLIEKGKLGIDGYIINKYVPRLENVSCSSVTNSFPPRERIDIFEPDVNGKFIKLVENEWANMVFLSSRSDFAWDYHVFKYGTVFNGDFYLGNNVANDSRFVTDRNLQERIVGLAQKSIKKDYNGNIIGNATKYIVIDISVTDNDINVGFYKGKILEQFYLKQSIKLVINVEFSTEDYFQNVNYNQINPIILRDIVLSKNIKYLSDCFQFCDEIQSPLSNLFLDAANNYLGNKSAILYYNKFKDIYKSLVSASIHGLSSATCVKLLRLMNDGIVSSKSGDYKEGSGIVASLLNGLKLDRFGQLTRKKWDKIDANSLVDFLSEFVELGSLKLNLGNDVGYEGNIITNIRKIPEMLKAKSKLNLKQYYLTSKRRMDNVKFDHPKPKDQDALVTIPEINIKDKKTGRYRYSKPIFNRELRQNRMELDENQAKLEYDNAVERIRTAEKKIGYKPLDLNRATIDDLYDVIYQLEDAETKYDDRRKTLFDILEEKGINVDKLSLKLKTNDQLEGIYNKQLEDILKLESIINLKSEDVDDLVNPSSEEAQKRGILLMEKIDRDIENALGKKMIVSR